MDARFSPLYEVGTLGGRLSIAPEKLMRALWLQLQVQVQYNGRSLRQFFEGIQFNLLFRLLVGLAVEDTGWHHPVFS